MVTSTELEKLSPSSRLINAKCPSDFEWGRALQRTPSITTGFANSMSVYGEQLGIQNIPGNIEPLM